MNLDTITLSWNSFFFAPVSVYPVALYRILFGTVLLVDAVSISMNASFYLGPGGLLKYSRYRKRAYGRSLSLFLYLPPTVTSMRLILGLHFAAVVLVIAGFLTPLSAVIAFVTNRSIVSRSDQTTNGGDIVASILGFLLIFTPAGHALSVDALLFGGAAFPVGDAALAAPWAQRLMQIQICFLYFNTMYWKLKGATWRDGSAVYYACTNDMYRLVPFPRFLLRAPMVQTLTWGVLALEFALAPGLWIEDFRPWLLIAAVGMHLAFAMFLNIHLFSFYMISALVLFLSPQEADSLLGLL